MKKIKVLYIINSFLMGGAQRVVLDLASNLDKEKFEITVCSLKPNIVEHGKYFDLVALGREHRFDTHEFTKAQNSFFLFWQLLKYIKREKPDIIHCHLPWAAILGTMAGRLTGVKNIIIHEHNSARFYSSKLDLFLKIARRLAKTSICYSELVQKEIFGQVCHFDQKCTNIDHDSYTIFNGVNVRQIEDQIKNVDFVSKRKSINLEDEQIVILSAARLVAWKGHANLLRAFAMLKNENIVLVFAGQGVEENNLKKLAKDLKVESRVIFLGSRTDVVELLAISDIFASVLSYPDDFSSESIGLSALEAMAAGLPTLIGDYPGIPGIFQNNTNIMIVKPKDAVALAEALTNLISHESIRKSVSQSAKQVVSQNFDNSKIIKIYQHLYSLLAI